MSSTWAKLWTRIPFPKEDKPHLMTAWIINTQEQTILRLQFLMVITVVTFITIIVTGKIWLGWFP